MWCTSTIPSVDFWGFDSHIEVIRLAVVFPPNVKPCSFAAIDHPGVPTHDFALMEAQEAPGSSLYLVSMKTPKSALKSTSREASNLHIWTEVVMWSLKKEIIQFSAALLFISVSVLPGGMNCKGVLGSECQTGGRLVGCCWSLEKKKKGLHQFLAGSSFVEH